MPAPCPYAVAVVAVVVVVVVAVVVIAPVGGGGGGGGGGVIVVPWRFLVCVCGLHPVRSGCPASGLVKSL